MKNKERKAQTAAGEWKTQGKATDGEKNKGRKEKGNLHVCVDASLASVAAFDFDGGEGFGKGTGDW